MRALGLSRAPKEIAKNQEGDEQNQAAVIENRVQRRVPLRDRWPGVVERACASEPPIEEVRYQGEPTDTDPCAEGHVAIFALSGQVLDLGRCSGMTAGDGGS
jgi:hypothetical protein